MIIAVIFVSFDPPYHLEASSWFPRNDTLIPIVMCPSTTKHNMPFKIFQFKSLWLEDNQWNCFYFLPKIEIVQIYDLLILNTVGRRSTFILKWTWLGAHTDWCYWGSTPPPPLLAPGFLSVFFFFSRLLVREVGHLRGYSYPVYGKLTLFSVEEGPFLIDTSEYKRSFRRAVNYDIIELKLKGEANQVMKINGNKWC